MKSVLFAARALTAASTLHAQSPAPAIADLSQAVPLPGNWAYAAAAGGSQSLFSDASARPQLTIRCTRSTRRVSISKPAGAAAPFLNVWTSSLSRALPASFNPATAQLTAELPMMDPLLDAMAFSRGRLGVSVSGQPALVVPSWEEIARVIEDCRV